MNHNPLTHVARKAASSPNTSSHKKPTLKSVNPVARKGPAPGFKPIIGVISSGKHAATHTKVMPAYPARKSSTPRHRSGY